MKKVLKAEQDRDYGYAETVLCCGVTVLLGKSWRLWSRGMQVGKGRILQETVARLPKLGEGEGLLLQPYKKDRSIYVIRRKERYQVLEWGFARKEFAVETAKVRKLLKTLCKKEFPRSNKIWLNVCTAEEVDRFIQGWG